jgi:hypothetical protein
MSLRPYIVSQLLLNIYRCNIQCSVHMERRLFCLELHPIKRQGNLAGIKLSTLSSNLRERDFASCMCPKSARYPPSKSDNLTVRILLEFASQLKPFC